MTDITIKMKDGTVREFKHTPRPGGSYDMRLKTVEGFAVVIDEYDRETYIPSTDIAEINVEPHRRPW